MKTSSLLLLVAATVSNAHGAISLSLTPQAYFDELSVVPTELDFDDFPVTPSGGFGLESTFEFNDLTVEFFLTEEEPVRLFPGLEIHNFQPSFSNRFVMEVQSGFAVITFEKPVTSFGLWAQDAETNGTVSFDTGNGFESVEMNANVSPATWPDAFVYTISETPFQTLIVDAETRGDLTSDSFFYTFAVPEPSSSLLILLSGLGLLSRRSRQHT